jgi:hypothetical protein
VREREREKERERERERETERERERERKSATRAPVHFSSKTAARNHLNSHQRKRRNMIVALGRTMSYY